MDDIFQVLGFFKSLTQTQKDILREIFTPCDFSAGFELFEQDSPAENLYIVVQGEVVVNFKPDDGPPITVARVHTGEVVGWSAALSSRYYTSSAIAETYTQLLRVKGADLRRICRMYPDIGKIVQDCLAAVIVERVKITHAQVVALLELGLGVAESS